MKNLEWLVETEERCGSNILKEGIMFSYATPNNIFTLAFDCMLYSQPITLDFWYRCIGVYGQISVDLYYV